MERKLLALILAMMMVLTLVPVAAFAGEAETYDYVAIGSAAARGYGLEEFGADVVEGSYPSIIAKYLEDTLGESVDTSVFAFNGMRYEELRTLLDFGKDGAYTGDNYTAWQYDETVLNSEYAGELKAAIEGAELITLDLGSESFRSFIFNKMMYDCYEVHFDDVLDKESDKEFVNDLRDIATEEILKALDFSLTKDELEEVYEYAELFPYAFASFCESFDACIKEIKALNPNAKIVVMGIPEWNDDAEIVIGETGIPVLEVMDYIVGAANIYMKNLSKEKKAYTFVPMTFKGGLQTNLNTLLTYEDGAIIGGDTSLTTKKIDECLTSYDNDVMWLGETIDGIVESSTSISGLSTKASVSDSAYLIAKDMIAKAMRDSVKYNSKVNILFAVFAEDALKAQLNTVAQAAIDQAWEAESLYGLDDFDLYAYLNVAGFSQALSFCVRTCIGSSYFTEPNETGHKQMAYAVIGAIGSDRGTIDKEIDRVAEKIADEIAEEISKAAVEYKEKVEEAIEKREAAEQKAIEKYNDFKEDVVEFADRQVSRIVTASNYVVKTITDGLKNLADKIDSIFTIKIR